MTLSVARPTQTAAEKGTMRILRSGFRYARRPLNSLALRRYRQEGLPTELYPAIEYWLTNKRRDAESAVAARVEAIRERLAAVGSTTIGDYGVSLGAQKRDDSLAIEGRSADYVAHRASVPESQGVFLYLCADGFSAKRVLELGTCAGISGCYLGLTPACRDLVSIEISSPLARVAEVNLQQVTSHATVINAPFDEGIGDALALKAVDFDLIWIDGHHESAPTLRYFERLRGHVTPGRVMLFDDINWPEMHSAWSEVRRWPGFSHTLNTGRLGIGVLKRLPSDRPPENWKLKKRLGITSLERE